MWGSLFWLIVFPVFLYVDKKSRNCFVATTYLLYNLTYLNFAHFKYQHQIRFKKIQWRIANPEINIKIEEQEDDQNERKALLLGFLIHALNDEILPTYNIWGNFFG